MKTLLAPARKYVSARPGWEEVAADWPSIVDVAVCEDVLIVHEQKRF